MQYTKDNFTITDDSVLLNKEFFIKSIQDTYLGVNRSRKTIEKSIQNSVVLSLFDDSKQVGFVRIISDFATYAYVCDLYISLHYRKQGLGTWLMQCVMEHPAAKVNVVTLMTRDAHERYTRNGFVKDMDILQKSMIKINDIN